MRSILLLLGGAAAALAQPISFGVKAGVPLTDFVDAVNGSRTSVTTTTNRYIVGPTVELRLPAGFSVEGDALYRHFRFNSSANLLDAILTVNTATGAWEFPLLLKKKFMHGPIRPFVDAGVSFNKISGASQTVTSILAPSRITTTSNSNPPELTNDFTTGFTMGGGLDIHALLIHITPEIRYTRWSTQNFNTSISGGSLHSNLSQAEFIVGFTF